eukprot:TRINITY_DN2269_c0_g1_i2.p1 TRINITY_DN2269_c0_g1~~TRINITY_DN2269_c0_g1_i2.p1  ORF type:complete len:559 (-),score=140.13 TRINITY_DN2269_c0_g1_i2:28-1704(-)
MDVEFVAVGGVGQKLQAKLERRAKEKRNWLEDWWYSRAYLIWRCPISITSNYYFLFDAKITKSTPQLRQAARLITGMLLWKQQLDTQQITPESMRGGSVPLCMNQYSKIFTTARIPTIGEDVLVTQAPGRHIIVMCGHRMYTVDVIASNQKQISSAELERQLTAIHFHAKANSHTAPRLPVSLLTAHNRDIWARCRQELGSNTINASILSTIDTAIAVLCLDDRGAANIDDAGHRVLGGQPDNRWYDKVVQFVVLADGRAGLNGEHSPLDALATASMCDGMLARIASLQPTDADPADTALFTPAASAAQQVTELKWQVPQSVEEQLVLAEAEVRVAAANLDFTLLEFPDYGADWIKNVAKQSPDAWFQMAMQLAYRRTMGRGCATYETAQTRQFYHGRTETVRVFSADSAAFTASMLDRSASVAFRRTALERAIKAQNSYMAASTNAMGCDRHLLGLRLIAAEENLPTPAIFADPCYGASTTFRLSTSNVTANHFFAGFGAVCDDGYGCCYGLRPNELVATCSAYHSDVHTSATKFKEALRLSLLDMRDLYTAPTPKL